MFLAAAKIETQVSDPSSYSYWARYEQQPKIFGCPVKSETVSEPFEILSDQNVK